MTLKIGFIGAGKAGCSFGKYLTVCVTEAGTNNDGSDTSSCAPQIEVAGYYSKSTESAAYAAKLTGSEQFESLEYTAASCDLIFLTVPDGNIEEVFQELVSESRKTGLSLENKIFAHLSGSLSSNILSAPVDPGISNNIDNSSVTDGFKVFSLHPACSIPNKTDAWQGLKDAVFVYEGSDECRKLIEPLLDTMGNRIGSIDPYNKTLYHAACVFLSNLGVGLAYEGQRLLESCGLEPEVSNAFFKTLFLGNAKNVAENGPVAALTGPAERNDVAVVDKHAKELSRRHEELQLRIYLNLTETLTKIAEEKHPDRKYKKLKSLLLKYKLKYHLRANSPF